MTRPSSRTALALTAVAVLAVTAACGDDDDDEDVSPDTSAGAVDTAPAVTTAAPATSASPATSAAAATSAAPATSAGEAAGTDDPAGQVTVATAESEYGTILVDGEGLTLYLFLQDDQGPSTCEADCLTAWPSLTGPATAGEGVDESLLGTAARPDDGSEQVTYNGWPLYYFAQDSDPGDVNGQGVGDVWFVLDPEGEPIPAS